MGDSCTVLLCSGRRGWFLGPSLPVVLLPTSGQRRGCGLSGSGLRVVACVAKGAVCFSPSLSGKYLNVVRECGHDVTCPAAKEVIYTLKERAYVEQIEKAFSYASKVLLGFLMEEKELVAHLRCAASSWGRRDS